MRKSPIAGSWYPGGKQELQQLVTELFAGASLPALDGRPLGIIAPHAGIQFSGAAAASGFKTLQGCTVKRVILLGPSHHRWFHGLATSAFDAYETPLGPVAVDQSISAALAGSALFKGPQDVELPEHSLEMELPFLQVALGEFQLVPLVVGELERDDYRRAADLLLGHVDQETIVVASSDFTHYGQRFGYVPFRDEVKNNLKKLDGGAIEFILAKDFEGYLDYLSQTGATICGARPIGLLMNMMPADARATLLSYYTSGDIIGDYCDTVSYASIVFSV